MREGILPIEIIGMLICFGAFIVITLTGEEDSKNISSSESVSFGAHLLGIILSFVSAWLVAGAFVASRLLKGVDT